MMTQKPNRIDAATPSQPTSPEATSSVTLPTSVAITTAFPVVGLIGAAGSRLALEKFFRTLPTDTGMAFIVATRLAAKEQRLLATALQARTDLPVLAATDGVLLQSDQIYLVPSGLQPTVDQGRLHLQPVANTPAHRRFDRFLTSLAVEQGANAVALLLSGAGEDGIAGLQTIKAHGGLVLVQEPNEAAYPTLPSRGVDTGLADCVDKVGELAQWLVQSRGDLANLPTTELSQDEHFLQTLPALLSQIASHTGHDLSHYKRSTLQRRMLRRMRAAGAASLLHYLELLKSNVLETVALFRDCLVSVTSFFRDTEAYEMLARDCIPQLFQGKGRSDLVRVWVAGCATGEEAYSVAMQLAEHAAQLTEPPRWQIFATDLDDAAVTIARRGLYPATIAKDIAPARIQRYFTEENGCYRVKPEIRENILFAAHDLLQDPPFSRLDLICCRNVLIYFTRPAQEKVFATFHYALHPSGYLFLGASESIDAANDLFAVLNKQCHLYQRRNITLLPPRRPLGNVITAPPVVVENKPVERLTQRAAEKPRTLEEVYAAWSLRVHTPPRLLVNQNYEITHLFGGADRYLQMRDGAVTQNVLQRIHPDLRLELRAALYQAFNQRERTTSRLLPVALHPRAEVVQLQVGPVAEPGFPADYLEVVLIAQENSPLLELGAMTERKESDFSLVSRLEEELLRTRERLQQIIDEYETAGQELKISNEELQSINEELKSTTEELETSKEELQSMNEELTTVNGELTRKIEELHRANSDLLNLIASTEVGAIFLNQQLQINRFTPRASDLFNLIEGDIGRPFAHVTHRLRHPDLAALATQVKAANAHIEETLQRDDNRWFMLRLFPYRTVTGESDGVVITFIDIHDLKRAESEERQRRQQQSLAELSRQALTGVDLDTFLTAVTHRVAEVLDMELCHVLQLQPADKTLLLRAGIGWQEGLVGQATVPADVSIQAGYTLQSNAPVIVRDLQTESRFRASDLLHAHAVRSGMSVTIPVTDPTTASVEIRGAYGVLGVHTRQLRAFTPYDINYLQAVANLLAATIARRATESALRREEERYRFIFDTVGVSIWEEDFTAVQTLLDQLHTQGVDNLRAYFTAHPAVVAQAIAAVRIHNVNQQTVTLFGANDKAQLLASLDRIFVPETQAIFVEELITLAEGRSSFAAETVLQTLQGERRHVLFTVTFPTTTRLDRVLVNIVDITERKVAEATQQRYADLLRLSHDAILVWNPEGGIEFWNRGAETLYGYTADEALGQVTHQLLKTEHFHPWREILAELQRIGHWEGEVRHTAKTGRPLLVSTRHQLITNAAGDWLILETNRDITERKAAEAALRQSEERFVTIFQHSPYPIAILALETRTYVDVNPTWVRDTGYTRDEALGRIPAELGLQTEPSLNLTERLRNGEPVRDLEIQVQIRNGEVRTALVSAELIQLTGQPHILLVFADITARKQAEERLRFLAEAGALLAGSLDYTLTLQNVADAAVPDIADWCVIDLLAEDGSFQEGVIAHRDPAKVRWAQELRTRYPIDPSAPLGAPQVSRTGQSELYPNITDAMLQAAAKNETELALLRSVGYRSVMVVPLQTHGRILGAITFVATDEERHFTTADLIMAEELARRSAAVIGNAQLHQALQQREQALRVSEERFRSAFEQAAVGMAHLNRAGQYIRVNDRLCKILGYDRAALLQMKFLDLTHPEDRANSLALSERLLTGEISSYSVEKRYIHRNGSMIWVNITASTVRNVAGEITHRLSVIEDITARKAAEAALHELTATLEQRVHERTIELEHSNRELDQFAYVASHDLKAPLRAIINLAGWVAEDAGSHLPASSLEHLQKLRKRALRMDRLLDDLLIYSRLDRRSELLEAVTLDRLIQDIVEMLAPPPGFTITTTGVLPALMTARAPLELVLRNLINNAIKHHHQPAQGVVEISVQEMDSFVEIAVRDNGPGIAPQHHERIFGMFQTLRPRDDVEGSGMGLALVKKAVEQRKGTIRLTSAPNQGTTFFFTWPKNSSITEPVVFQEGSD